MVATTDRSGLCDVCKRKLWRVDQAQDGRRNRFYDSPKWKYVRDQRRMHSPMCEVCRVHIGEEVDHVVAMSDGGEPYAFSNTQHLCKRCHAVKRGQERKN
jgi:5-methylcytosine-specific restriction endonuclease McrA